MHARQRQILITHQNGLYLLENFAATGSEIDVGRLGIDVVLVAIRVANVWIVERGCCGIRRPSNAAQRQFGLD